MPIHFIVCHLKIEFEDKALLLPSHNIKNFQRNNPSIVNTTPPYERYLSMANQFKNDELKPSSEHPSNEFVNPTQNKNWSEVTYIR